MIEVLMGGILPQCIHISSQQAVYLNNRTCRWDLKEAEKKSMSGKTKGGLDQTRAKN